MYIRVSRGRLDPSKNEEMLRIGPDIAAAIKALPGCQGYQGGWDRVAGKTIAVSTWDTEGHAQFARDALGDVVPRLQALGLQLDPPEFYEPLP